MTKKFSDRLFESLPKEVQIYIEQLERQIEELEKEIELLDLATRDSRLSTKVKYRFPDEW